MSETDSTNLAAQNLLSKNKPPEGTVISTFHQFNGRGQIGSKWESEPGKNISLSVILYPIFLPANKQFLLNQAVSLAVWDFAAHYFPTAAKIKWPNDLYIGDQKVAGVLIQNAILGQILQSSVVGIGINVNQTHFVTKPPNPVSFKMLTGEDFDLPSLIAQLCEALERRYLELKNGQIVPIQTAYLENLYRFDRISTFHRADGQVFEGKICGVTASGRLLIRVGDREESFDLKEVGFCF